MWATEENADTLIRQIDDALAHANARCAELIEEAERKRGEHAARLDEERLESARFQEKLDRL